MATEVEAGRGQTPSLVDYRFRLSQSADSGIFEVNLKDLSYTETGDAFFRSSRFEYGGHEWELKLEFDRNFKFLRFLGRGRWRLGTKRCLDDVWSTSKQLLWKNWRSAVLPFRLSDKMCRCGWKCLGTWCSYLINTGILLCFAEGADKDVIVSSEGASDACLARCVAAALSVRNYLFLLYLSGIGILLLFTLLIGSAVLAVIVCLVIIFSGLSFTILMALWMPPNLLYALCYSITVPIWATTPTLSSKLRLKSRGEVDVQCKTSLTRDHPPFFNKIKSVRRRLTQNTILETRGFANANCLKTARHSTASRWTTIRAEIKIEEANCIEVVTIEPRCQHEIRAHTPSSPEMNSWIPPIVNVEEKPLCIICLTNPATSGFAHQHTVHVCMCEPCIKEYNAQRGSLCPICRSEVEHVIYKIY